MTNKEPLKLNWKTWLIIAAVLFVAAFLIYKFIDRSLLRYIYTAYGPDGLDISAVWVRGLKSLGKGVVIVFLLVLMGTRKPKPALIGLLALCIVAAAVLPIKYAGSRERPKREFATKTQVLPKGDIERVSFPSGDAATFFVLVGLAAIYCRPSAVILLAAVGATVALFRVLSLNHYVSDVLAGAGIGILAAGIAYEWGTRLINDADSRFFCIIKIIAFIVAGAMILGSPWLRMFVHVKNFLIVFGVPAAMFYLLSFYSPFIEWIQKYKAER